MQSSAGTLEPNRSAAHPRTGAVAWRGSQEAGIPFRMWPPYSRVAMREDLARRARRDVLRAAHEGVDWVTMVDLLAAAIGKAVPFGFHCWGPIDPATLIFTGATAREAT